MIRFLILVSNLIGVPSYAQDPFQFLLKQSIAISSEQDCGPAIDQVSEVLIPNENIREAVVTGFIRCDPQGSIENREIEFEMIFQSTEQYLQVHFEQLKQTDVFSQKLLPEIFRSIFTNRYYLAQKGQSNDWQSLAGFEAPIQFVNLREAIQHKNSLRDKLATWSKSELYQHMQGFVGERGWKVWKEQVLPETNRVEVQYHQYALIESSNKAIKLRSVYYLRKDLF